MNIISRVLERRAIRKWMIRNTQLAGKQARIWYGASHEAWEPYLTQKELNAYIDFLREHGWYGDMFLFNRPLGHGVTGRTAICLKLSCPEIRGITDEPGQKAMEELE